MGHPLYSERGDLRAVYTRTRGQWQMAWLVSQGPGKDNTGWLEIKQSREEHDGWTHSCGHCVLWTFIAENALNSQGDRRTPVDNSWPLSSVMQGLAQWTQEWSAVTVDMETSKGSRSPRLSQLQPLLGVWPVSTRDRH